MILQALNGAYDRFSREKLASGKPRVPPYGYSYERISYALVLDKAGKLLDVAVVDGGELDVPSDPTITRTSAIEPMFLWDKTAYVLGFVAEVKKRTADEHSAFKKRQRDLVGGIDDPGLQALLSFLDAWEPSPANLLRYRDEVIGTNVVFLFDGGYLHDRPAARDVWQRHLQGKRAEIGPCLIRGEQARIALTHPTLGGVRGAQSSGASIVSFNQPSFTSYGKDQGANAPVSEQAAFAYTTALNDLLRKESRQKVQIGDATTVFWAEAADPVVAQVAEKAFGWLSEPPSLEQLDEGETDRLRRMVMDLVAKGRPLESPELNLKKDTRFYILGLAPNAARLSVRLWEATTLGAIGEAFHDHFRDLQIVPQPWNQLPAIKRLLIQAAPLGDADRIPGNLAGEVMRAILSGRRYPQTLLSQALIRLRSDHSDKNQTRTAIGLRTALVKACLSRDFRFGIEKEDVPVSLDRENTNPGYRLGRLFAVLEGIQSAALPGINATIRDRFYASASATPSSVFPILIAKSNHHLSNLKKAEKAGLAVWFEREIGEIVNGIDRGEFPRALRLQDQGRFAIGYYQQRFTKRADAPAEVKAADTDIETDD